MIRQTKYGFWVIDSDTHFTVWTEESGRLDHDHYVLNIMKQHLGNGAAIDIGANIGTHTIAYANILGTENVIAIEPNLECVECLRKNIPGISVLEYAVSDTNGEGRLHLEKNVGASYMCNGSGIKTIRLDDYDDIMSLLVKNKPFTFLKMDVEGYEVKALRGGRNFIQKYKPKMWIEVNLHTLKRNNFTENDLLNEIKELGYRIISYPEKGIQYDVLCIPN
jgi:FkbM family methyltransferase